MNVLIQFCFVQVVGGYVNVAQIVSVDNIGQLETTPNKQAYVVLASGDVFGTGDKTPADFLDRVKKTCGGKSE